MKYLASILLALMSICASAQTIADRINASGNAVVVLPAELNARLMAKVAAEPAPEQKDAATPTGGYRIQVFSGNNARTAKHEAESRAAQIREQFADINTYVIFDAPYWRLRAGDFTTYEEAAAALGDLKRAFPTYAREMRLVRDRINAR